MAAVTYTGNGTIASTDYHAVTWTGKTKGGKSVEITLPQAVNLGNIEWTFAEKDDVVADVTFEGVYTNTDAASTSTSEPWSVEYEDGVTAGANEIVLGAGVFAIDGVDVALTRGGGSFKVEREARKINADGDRGGVEGRIVFESAIPTLNLKALTMLTKVSSLYPGISTT